MGEITLKALNTIYPFLQLERLSQSQIGKQQPEGDKLRSPGEGSRSLLILLNLGA